MWVPWREIHLHLLRTKMSWQLKPVFTFPPSLTALCFVLNGFVSDCQGCYICGIFVYHETKENLVTFLCVLRVALVPRTRMSLNSVFIYKNQLDALISQIYFCFGQFLCPSSGVFRCTHSNGIIHTGLR